VDKKEMVNSNFLEGWKTHSRSISYFFSAGNGIWILLLLAVSFQMPIPGNIQLDYTVVEIALMAIISCYLLQSQPVIRSIQGIMASDPMAWVLMLWSLWGVISWFVSHDWAYGTNEMRWVFLSLIAYLILRTMGAEDKNKTVKTFLLVSVGIACVADIQALTDLFLPPFTMLPTKVFYISPTLQFSHAVAVGFFRHPNAFGAYVYWPCLLSLGLATVPKTRRWGIIGFGFFGISLFLSYYRTLLLGAGFAVIIFFLLRARLSPRKWIILFLGACFVGALAFLGFYLLNRNSSFFSNFNFRINQWINALPIFAASPLTFIFGSGTQIAQSWNTGLARSDPHNAYLYMLVHYGLPGLLIYLGIIWIILERGWRAYRLGAFRDQPLWGAFWVGFIVWYLTAFFDSRLTTGEWQFQFVLLLALFMNGLDRKDIQIPGQETNKGKGSANPIMLSDPTTDTP
jgi:hypothetical protein